MRAFVGLLLVTCSLGLVYAPHAKVEPFSNLSDSIRKKEVDGNVLLLNGIATHRRFVFNVYRLSLYLISPSQDGEQIISSNELKFAEMQFLRDISSKDLQEAFLETFNDNCANDCERLKPEIQRLITVMPDMRDGEKVDFIFYPKKSVIRGFNDKTMEFESPEFGRFFIRAWLGNNPPSQRFKRELLNLSR